MYKYVKGVTVLSEDRMNSANEVAQEYNLWMPSKDSILIPNGILVEFIIRAYCEEHNYKTSDYYYLQEQTRTYIKVYSKDVVEMCMDEFMIFLKDNNITPTKDKVYNISGFNFLYYEPQDTSYVINFNEFKKRKGKQ